jgi:sulfoacetaldehyde dehydrogenase
MDVRDTGDGTVVAVAGKETGPAGVVAGLVARARAAMELVSGYDQDRVNEVVQAVAWAIIERERAEELARVAVEDTGLGNVGDKVDKNQRKTLGTLRDLLEPTARSVGVISVDEEKGITEIAKPVGVVAAVTPSTNPGATPANKVMMALKGRNAVIVAPSPKGVSTCALLLEYIHAELGKIGAPLDLVQMLPEVNKEMTHELMKQADFLTVTGSASNVRAGQTSGTPNACVSAGNVVSIVDRTADIRGRGAQNPPEQDLRLRHELLQRQLGRDRGPRLRGDGRGAGARGRVLLRR